LLERAASTHLAQLGLGLLIALPVLLTGCDRRPAAMADPGGQPPRPNIIFILVDTLRADRLGCYGHSGELSPMMDALAREGVLFEQAIATSPWTLPSVASYFCGYYPTVHKVTRYAQALDASLVPRGQVRLFGEQFTTLAEALQANGYRAAGFSANPFIVPKYGFAQGFDYFDASFAANDTPGDVVNAAALRWLAERDASRPFFLYLHYMDVHDPYTASDTYVGPLVDAVERMPDKRRLSRAEAERHRRFFSKSGIAYGNSPQHRRLFQYAEYWQARYEAGILQVNHYLDELRAKLEEMGLWQDAYVILTADHGESLGEHELWAHGLSAHQDQLHVPLILRWPGKLPAGKRIPQTVRLFDIMPTLLEQLQIPPVGDLQAKSLVDLIRGQTDRSLLAFAEAVKRKPGQKALVLNEWKLLAHTDEGRYELYNLDDDPTEQRDLAGQSPERVAGLRRLLEEQMTENHARSEGVEVQHADVTEEELRRFRALGYLDGGEAEEANRAEGEADPNHEESPQP
jgi:arylsulfatase